VRTGIERWALVPAPAVEVWERVTAPEGINDELRPLLRMTVPRRLRGMRIGDLPEGRPLGRSWFLLFGVLPVDVDEITLERIDPPRMFREHSRMVSFEDWVHQRQVIPVGDRVSLVWDEVSWVGRGWTGRSPTMRAIQRRALHLLFAHRHRRLVGHYARRVRPEDLGGPSEPVPPLP
jgi:hypothetical protein